MSFDYSEVVGLHDTHICSIEAGILRAVATNTRIASLGQLRQLTGRVAPTDWAQLRQPGQMQRMANFISME